MHISWVFQMLKTATKWKKLTTWLSWVQVPIAQELITYFGTPPLNFAFKIAFCWNISRSSEFFILSFFEHLWPILLEWHCNKTFSALSSDIWVWPICLHCRRPGFNPWVRKILWRRKWQPIPIFLPGKSHGQRILAGYSSWGHKELDTAERRTVSVSLC